jgi:2-hydroxy-6-oxonona-2,4-dienedioate hydrolase
MGSRGAQWLGLREGYVDADGIKTRYLEEGRGEPMLLIHGAIFGSHGSADCWVPIMQNLGKRFHVYALDKVGCGFSDNPKKDEDYTITETVKHAYDFMKSMKMEKAHVAGHSRGGYAVTRLALEHPEMVKTLTIVSSSTLMTPPNPQYEIWEKEAEKLKDERERQRYLVTVNSYSASHVTDAWVEIMAKIVTLPKTREALAKMNGGLRKRFKEELVAKQQETHQWIRSGGLKVPTLIMWGLNDPSATMERCGIPCMNLVMPFVSESEMHVLNHAGHFCYREQPRAFESVLTGFIERHPT